MYWLLSILQQINESECDYLIEQKLPVQVERDYLKDPEWRVVKMEKYLDSTNTPFPYRSLFVPLREYEMRLQYNPYYLLKRIGRQNEEPVEVCVEKDTCILQSNEEYLDEEIDL